MIVLADADLPRAAHAAVGAASRNSGQVCIRTERVLVEDAVADRFVDARGRRDRAPAPGAAPARPAGRRRLDVGAITFAPQIERARAAHRRRASRAAAASSRAATRRADLPGSFFAPTLIADATPDMAVMREETFGPVLPVMRVADAEAALRVANDSPMGLSGSVWSGDARARRARSRAGCEAGSVCVNDVLVNYFCVEAPLGGIKGSGMRLPPRPRGAAPVLPHRDHRRGPPAARLAVAAARPRADVPLQARARCACCAGS